jgi:hypothetical protein
MTQVKALVVYPINVSFELEPETAQLSPADLQDYLWKKILHQADRWVDNGDVAPVIVSCSEPGVVVRGAELSTGVDNPETQADWTLLALQTLQKTQQSLRPALAARAVLKPSALADKITKLDQELSQVLKDLIAAISPNVDIVAYVNGEAEEEADLNDSE